MKPKALLRVIAVGAALCAAQAVKADDTGFDAIHSKIRVGGKICFDGHSHSGSSSGAASRKLAEAKALQSWYGYTAGEYGSDWANINKAIKKRLSCSQSGGGWGCDLEATPCK